MALISCQLVSALASRPIYVCLNSWSSKVHQKSTPAHRDWPAPKKPGILEQVCGQQRRLSAQYWGLRKKVRTEFNRDLNPATSSVSHFTAHENLVHLPFLAGIDPLPIIIRLRSRSSPDSNLRNAYSLELGRHLCDTKWNIWSRDLRIKMRRMSTNTWLSHSRMVEECLRSCVIGCGRVIYNG